MSFLTMFFFVLTYALRNVIYTTKLNDNGAIASPCFSSAGVSKDSDWEMPSLTRYFMLAVINLTIFINFKRKVNSFM